MFRFQENAIFLSSRQHARVNTFQTISIAGEVYYGNATLYRENNKEQTLRSFSIFSSSAAMLFTKAVVRQDASSFHRGRSRHGRRGGETPFYSPLGFLSLLMSNIFFFLSHVRRMLGLFGRMTDRHANAELAKRQHRRR